MKPTDILYEPTPIARIGVRRDGTVVVGTDYSCFAYMLEEYIGHGVLNIVIPNSAPESSLVDDVPDLLKKRLKVVDDQKEQEAAVRLFFSLRRELNVEFSENENRLRFPKSMAPPTRNLIRQLHDDVKRLAFGFNHGVHIELDTILSAQAARQIRQKVQDPDTRVILSYIEGLLSRYELISFDSIAPKESTPKELISIFDRLFNDPDYVTFSQSVSALTDADTRQRALVEIRELVRRISSKKFIGATWDYITKILKVWPGIPLPESKDFSSLINGRNIPAIVNMAEPRSRAVENWLSYAKDKPPLAREGKQRSDYYVAWLPPAPSMKVGGPSSQSLTLGTARELVQLFTEVQKKHPEQNEDQPNGP